jgi:hypothetical protein
VGGRLVADLSLRRYGRSGMESAREPESSAAPEHSPAPAAAAPLMGPRANSRAAAYAAVARQAALQAGNRATLAILREQPGTTEDMHKAIYGDGNQHPSAPPAYEFSDDPLADGGFELDKSIRVKPGPVRTTLIRPKPDDAPKGEWLEDALKKDPLLKALPDWAREKAIGALKDIDETAAEKIIDALPWDGQAKGAALAAIKALLETAKGRKFKMPVAPPNPRLPDWQKPIEPYKAPGEHIFTLPPIKF